MPSVKWNPEVKLIISDVDETIADIYSPADPELVVEIERVIEENRVLFMVSGHGFDGIVERIVGAVHSDLRWRILVAHCSGAEVRGFGKDGNPREHPYYSLYETNMNKAQRNQWRDIVKRLIADFNLMVYDSMPVQDFARLSKANPLAIMLEDRGPQITLELVNGYNMTEDIMNKYNPEAPEVHGAYDLRIPIMEKVSLYLKEAGLPVTPRLAGEFAIDLAIEGVSKSTAIKYVIGNQELLQKFGLDKATVVDPRYVEIWGDKFSKLRGGTDRHMSEVLPKEVRSITFREENPSEFLEGYNIVVWDGNKHLHEGVLEYLQGR